MIKGAYTLSLRVQKAPFGRSWGVFIQHIFKEFLAQKYCIVCQDFFLSSTILRVAPSIFIPSVNAIAKCHSEHWEYQPGTKGTEMFPQVCRFCFCRHSGWWQLKYFLCASLFGEMLQIDEHIFEMGWNHELDGILVVVILVDIFPLWKDPLSQWYFLGVLDTVGSLWFLLAETCCLLTRYEVPLYRDLIHSPFLWDSQDVGSSQAIHNDLLIHLYISVIIYIIYLDCIL